MFLGNKNTDFVPVSTQFYTIIVAFLEQFLPLQFLQWHCASFSAVRITRIKVHFSSSACSLFLTLYSLLVVLVFSWAVTGMQLENDVLAIRSSTYIFPVPPSCSPPPLPSTSSVLSAAVVVVVEMDTFCFLIGLAYKSDAISWIWATDADSLLYPSRNKGMRW